MMLVRALAFSFLVVTIPAFALNGDGCEGRLEGRGVPIEVRDAFLYIHKIAPRLMSDVYEGKITVEKRRRWTPFQDAVSARYSQFRGRKLLIIREIDTSSAKSKQKFIWDIAQALFELQMEPWLWSKESLSARDEAAAALDVDENEDALAYFAVHMPKKWRDHYLEKASVLMRERYQLAASLSALEPKDIMDEAPPSGLNQIRLKVGAASIAPNLRDYNILFKKGSTALEKTFAAANEKALLAKYYFNHARRLLVASFMVSTLSLVPHLLEIPSYYEVEHEWQKYEESLQKAADHATLVQLRLLEQRRQSEIARLKTRITEEEAKAPRDESLLNRIKRELQQNLELSPGTIFKTDEQIDR